MEDLYQAVTDRIVQALEAGTPPWVRPWSSVTEAIPMNVQTGRPYRGVNFTLLSLEADRCSYPANRWLTYRQARELGGQVRRGEQGSVVVFWQLRAVAARAETFPDDDELPSQPQRVHPLLRAYTVFNVEQVDGLSAKCLRTAWPLWEADAKAEELLLMSEATIRYGGSRAYYRPATDEIQMPPRGAFPTATGYYNVALHELTHWTGHETRCNRQLIGRFGDDAYAAEELIAEMGAAFLCAYCRLDGELRHASYLGSWLKILRSDKRAIFTASAKAQSAADFLLARCAIPPSHAALAA